MWWDHYIMIIIKNLLPFSIYFPSDEKAKFCKLEQKAPKKRNDTKYAQRSGTSADVVEKEEKKVFPPYNFLS